MLEGKYHQSLCFLIIFLAITVTSKPVENEKSKQGPLAPMYEFRSCNNQSKSRPTITCPQMKEANGYSLAINADNFMSNEEIKVKVFRTKCPISNGSLLPRWYQLEAYWDQEGTNESTSDSKEPQLDTGRLIPMSHYQDFYQCDTATCPISNGSLLPRWYQLEAYWDQEGTNESTSDSKEPQLDTGRLIPMSHYQDFYQCDTATEVLFYPCEASLYNFPGRHIWKAPQVTDSNLQSGSVCFRLTVLEENSTACERIEKCIAHVKDIEIQALEELYDDTLTDYYDDLADNISSTEDDIHEDIAKETTLNLAPICRQNREFYKSINSSWIPQCDCEGQYQPIQCMIEQDIKFMTCWCSSKYGAQMSEPSIVDCGNESMAFELSCVPRISPEK